MHLRSATMLSQQQQTGVLETIESPSWSASQRGLFQMIADCVDNERIEFGCGCPRTDPARSAVPKSGLTRLYRYLIAPLRTWLGVIRLPRSSIASRFELGKLPAIEVKHEQTNGR